MTTSSIIVHHRFIGFHEWPDAPLHRSYLATTHRHEFHVSASIGVSHEDRQIEFHDFKDNVTALLPQDQEDIGATSCETIGRELFDSLNEVYGGNMLWVEVYEDGECGARIEP